VAAAVVVYFLRQRVVVEDRKEKQEEEKEEKREHPAGDWRNLSSAIVCFEGEELPSFGLNRCIKLTCCYTNHFLACQRLGTGFPTVTQLSVSDYLVSMR